MNKKESRQKENKKAYNQQVRRIKNFIKNAESRGFNFTFKPKLDKEKPTKRDVEHLKKYTPEALYKRSYYVDETGRKIKGNVRREQEKSESARRAARTRKAKQEARRQKVKDDHLRLLYRESYDRMMDKIEKFEGRRKANGKDLLLRFFEQQANKYGKENIGRIYMEAVSMGVDIDFYELYNADGARMYINRFLSVMGGMGVNITEQERNKIFEYVENDNGEDYLL